ncbi:hypothetical protein BDZ85DRAFT_264200 [Elsinoe ampelina]|uniref:Uncharacterized protein n=1 Tax=Elsinoe ampelina TaxID=302913 RepID=A0A6A6G7X6_9PEZI|nr:hypothetical protein BDZ85DRAFT_264200 [Elsinoe ampelina]
MQVWCLAFAAVCYTEDGGCLTHGLHQSSPLDGRSQVYCSNVTASESSLIGKSAITGREGATIDHDVRFTNVVPDARGFFPMMDRPRLRGGRFGRN